ncbi:MAG: phosphate:Na+ symporter [Bradymonadia bacterium]|jgi:phosphate:Na+ symporter
MKVNIAAFSMPMLVFGVIFLTHKSESLRGLGNLLAGLGFLFLVIHFMKEGFEAFRETIDLMAFAVAIGASSSSCSSVWPRRSSCSRATQRWC